MNVSNLWPRIQGRYQRSMARHFGRRPFTLRNSSPLISFTFDDFPVSALETAGVILERYGVAGTYYIALGMMGQDAPAGRIFSAPDLNRVVAGKHELGCHTFAHCDSWQTAPRVFEESIEDNRRALRKILPGASMSNLSYPISCPRPDTKRRAARHFACCRGGGQGFNAGTIDLNYVNAYFLEQTAVSPLSPQALIEQACRENGWLVFATHDVCENPTRLGCTPAFFEEVVACAVKSRARVVTVAQACRLTGITAAAA